MKNDKKGATLAGFEPTRRNASRFRIYLLNHSDIVSVTFIEKNSICEVFTKSTIRYFALRSTSLADARASRCAVFFAK
eukprot:scaffold16668_cov137-Skeletonema_menzelii.AAC.2